MIDLSFSHGSWREVLKVHDPEKVVVVFDHDVPSATTSAAASLRRLAMLLGCDYVRTRRLAGTGAGNRRRGAGVAELADALDLGSSDENRGGSNPPARTSRLAPRDE